MQEENNLARPRLTGVRQDVQVPRHATATVRTTAPEKGAVYNVVYPFARATYTDHGNGDEEGGDSPEEVPTWKPGVRHADKGEGDIESLVDAFGRMVLTVIDVHKPGKYPTRVFYTRTWVNPDGKAFGKGKLKITTVSAFLSFTRGYKHEFILAGCKCEGCKWPYHDHRLAEGVESAAALG